MPPRIKQQHCPHCHHDQDFHISEMPVGDVGMCSGCGCGFNMSTNAVVMWGPYCGAKPAWNDPRGINPPRWVRK